jgi:two-component system, NarL family, nitrate/nitrite response regulator NarL
MNYAGSYGTKVLFTIHESQTKVSEQFALGWKPHPNPSRSIEFAPPPAKSIHFRADAALRPEKENLSLQYGARLSGERRTIFIYRLIPQEKNKKMAQFVTPLPEMPEKIRVVAADSTHMSSQLLAQALAQNPQFQVSGIDPKPAAILAAVAHEKPNVVLMSSTLDESEPGFDLIRQVCASRPETRVVMLMDTSKRSAVVEAFRCGARGVFSRSESPRLLAKCISRVHQGQVWANSSELRYLLEALCESEPPAAVDADAVANLSRREQDVVRCVAEGLSNREIATRLKLTEHTVKNYLFRIFDKLNVSSRVEVVLYAFRFRKDLVGSAVSGGNSSTQGPNSYSKTQRLKTKRRVLQLVTNRPLETVPRTDRRVRA